MKIECVKDKLVSAVSKAEKITRKNITLPVLSSILLSAFDNTLKIKSTNLDIGIEITIPVKIEKEGVVAVSGMVLYNFLTHLYDDKNVVLEVVEGNLHVSTQHNKTVIKAVDASDFPVIPRILSDQSFKIPVTDFIHGLQSVWYSSGTSTVKPELASVYIYFEDGNIVFVATDSFRLAEKKIKLKKVKEFNPLLIPFRNVPEIKRVLEEVQGDLEIIVDGNQAAFVAEGIYLTSRVIDGNFPDYKQIIPKEHKTEAVILKQDLMNSFKIATIFADTFNQVHIEAKPSEKKFSLYTKNSDVGENNHVLDAAIKGQDIEINFNYKYIIDCFQSIEADSVSLQFNTLSKPVVIEGVGDKSFLYLVMPMNK